MIPISGPPSDSWVVESRFVYAYVDIVCIVDLLYLVRNLLYFQVSLCTWHAPF